jgi:protein TonB
VIRASRWLPLSLALHAATLGGGVWVVHEASERALFVDLTLKEPDERVASPEVGGGRAPAAVQVRRAKSPPRPPAPPPLAAPAPASPASSASSPSALANAEPAVAAPSPTSSASVPDVTPAPPMPSAVMVPALPVAESSSLGQAGAAGGAANESHTSTGAGMASDDGGDRAAVTGSGAARGAFGVRGARDGGALALAVPGDGGGETYGPYLAALRRRLQDALEYPASARRRGLSGTVHLEIALESTGRVTDVLVVRSSSHAVLDDAALDAARRLAQVPFPSDVRPRALRVRLPVVFELR